jgi:hypothetical protein
MVAFGLDGRVDDLVVKKLSALLLAGDAPCVVIEEAAQECELALLVENRNLNEIGELTGECLDALVEPRKITLNLNPKKGLHAVVGELGSEFTDGSGRIREEAAECSADALLRSGAFEQHCIEDFDLIKAVAFRSEKAAALIHSGLDHWIVIAGKGNLWPI